MIFCTLFDSNYLDKGIVLYKSLERVSADFRLYVLTFDDECYSILEQLGFKNMVLVSLEEFETENLLAVKEKRTRQEYCWMCGCHFIKHVLEHFGEPICTYIDADMRFYSSPQILFEEFSASGKSVGIIPHRFPEGLEGKKQERDSGKYCIEFNTFKNDASGREVLDWWCNQCIGNCTARSDGRIFGDQKYLDDWETRFRSVFVYENSGAGVAPWNLSEYRLVSKTGDGIELEYRKHEKVSLIFYHYHAVRYISPRKARISVYLRKGNVSKKLRDAIYVGYLSEVDDVRKDLKERFGKNLYGLVDHAKERTRVRRAAATLLRGKDPVGIRMRVAYRILVRQGRDFVSF